jgi:Serine acetyltransferase
MGSVLILGAGGHGKVIADILFATGKNVLGFLDDNPTIHGARVLGLPVMGYIEDYNRYQPDGLIMGIGNNHTRQMVIERLSLVASDGWITAVHPRAVISPSVQISSGSVIMAGAIINADTCIGHHAIINTGATVDHDCLIGDYVHIGPGVNLAGGVKVGDRTLIGIGAVVAPYHTIGSDVVVGAGAVVVNDIPPGLTVVGVPAKPLSKT